MVRIVTMTYCDDPAETFVLGELPAPATSLVIHFAGGPRVSAQTSARQADGYRAFVLAARGRPQGSSVEVLDDSGSRLLKDELVASLPCSDKGGVIFATQQHKLS